eukprot:gene7707-9025_t
MLFNGDAYMYFYASLYLYHYHIRSVNTKPDHPKLLNSNLYSLREEYENIIKDFYNHNKEVEYEQNVWDIVKKLNTIQYKNQSNIYNLDWFNNQDKSSIGIQQRLNVGIVVSSFEGLYSTSGIGTVYSILADFLVNRGHNVTVVYTRDEPTERKSFHEWKVELKKRGITLVSLPPSPIRVDNPSLVRKSYQVYQYLKDVAPQYDIVHMPDFEGMPYYSVMAKRDGLYFDRTLLVVGLHGPSSWVVHANTRKSLTQESEFELDYMERKSVQLADAVWTPSTYIVDWLQSQGWNIPAERLSLMPFLAPEAKSTAPSKPLTSVKELVFFGRVEQRKGAVLLCDALDLLARQGSTFEQRNIKITFLGRPSSIDGVSSTVYIRRRAASWPFKVSFIEDRTSQEAIEYLSAPDSGRLAVIPSLSDNAPYTLYECLYESVPFIASATPSMSPLIDQRDREAVLFDTKPYILMRKLSQVLKRGVIMARPTFSRQNSLESWSSFYGSLETLVASPLVPKTLSTNPLVSVCIVHFNRPALLKQAIESIEKQSYTNYEIILVDDGSNTTDSLEYLSSIEPKFKSRGWKLLRTPNRYLGAARNTAAKEARGSFLYFLDDDNYAFPEALSTYVRVSQTLNADVVTAPHAIITTSDRPSAASIERIWVPLGPSLAVGLFKNCFGDANFFISRNVFDRAGGFTEEYGVGLEDHELLAKLAIDGYRMAVAPDPLLYYRMHDTVNQMVFKTDARSNQVRYIRPYSRALSDSTRVMNVLARNAVIKMSATCNITLSSVSPNSGPLTGGTTIVIHGSGFECPINSILVGGAPCSGVHVDQSYKSVSCVTGRGPSTLPLDITVISQEGKSFTLHSGFTYISMAAPVGQECELSESGTTIICTFKPQTSATSSSCSHMLASSTLRKLGLIPSCSWSNSATLTIALGSSSSIEIGDTIDFLAGSITSVGGEPNNAQSLPLLSRVPETPVASIKAPTVLGPCDQLTLDGSYSSGSGGRTLSFKWRLINAVDHVTELENQLRSTDSKIQISNSSLSAGSTYTFELKVTNWLGKSDTTELTVQKRGTDVLIAQINGPSRMKISASDLIIEGSGKTSGCSSGQQESLKFWWKVQPEMPLDENTRSTRSLHIQASSWTSGTTYIFTLAVISPDGKVSEANTEVTVNKRSILALVKGGDKTFGRNDNVTLDASESSDPDDPKAELHFSWSCVSLDPTKKCELELPSQSEVTFNSSLLLSGMYLFSVQVTPPDDKSRSGIAQATVQITGLAFIDVAINRTALPLYIDPGQKIVLKSILIKNMIPLNRLVWSWTLDAGELAVDEEVAYSTPTNGRNLALKAGSLAAATQYIFSVHVYDELTNVTGMASITFITEARPSGGKIVCYTKSGKVTDKYVIDLGRAWGANGGVSGFSFHYRVDDDPEETPLGEKSPSHQMSTYLPPGRITIIGYVMSGTGVASSSTCEIKVARPSLDDSEVVLNFLTNVIKSDDLSVYMLATSLKVANSLLPPPSGKAVTKAEVAERVKGIKTSAVDFLYTKFATNVSRLTSEGMATMVDIMASATDSSTLMPPTHLSNSMRVMRTITSTMITNAVIPSGIRNSVSVIGNVNDQINKLYTSGALDPKFKPMAHNVTRDINLVATNIADTILYRSSNGEEPVVISRNGVSISTYKNAPSALNKLGGMLSGDQGEPVFTLQPGCLAKNMAALGSSEEVSVRYLSLPGNNHHGASTHGKKFMSQGTFSLEVHSSGEELDISGLTSPVVIDAGKHSKSNDYDCVWWNTKTSEWDSKGCTTETKGESVFCKCDHLTQFALLGKPKPASNLNRILIIAGSVVGCVVFAGLLVGMVVVIRRRNAKKRPDKKDQTKKEEDKKAKIESKEARAEKRKARAAKKAATTDAAAVASAATGDDADRDVASGSSPSSKTEGTDNMGLPIPIAKAKSSAKRTEVSFGGENEDDYILQEFKDIFEVVKAKEQSEAIKRRSPVSPLTAADSICSPSTSTNSSMPGSLASSPVQFGPYTEKHSEAARIIQKSWIQHVTYEKLKKELEVEQLLETINDLLADEQLNDPFDDNNYNDDDEYNVNQA